MSASQSVAPQSSGGSTPRSAGESVVVQPATAPANKAQPPAQPQGAANAPATNGLTTAPPGQHSSPSKQPPSQQQHGHHHHHQNGGGSVHRALSHPDNDAVSALSTDVRSANDDNMSGYSGQREDGATAYQQYYNRLTKFYLKYNPEKLNRVDEFLRAYRGEEEQLFKLLSEKYGPEPDPPRRSGSVCSTSDVGGPRLIVPRSVPRDVGLTEEDTPYWPGSKTVNDRDLCDVLESLQAANQDLAASYLGVLREHPAMARNGMTYVSATPVPADGSRFLGHLWAGTLANNKVLVHKSVQYHRTVLHCTDLCPTPEFHHERWRLTMYRAEHTPNVLFRTVWDPEIRLDPPNFDEGGSQGGGNDSLQQPRQRTGFQVQYATRRRPPSEPGNAVAAAAPVGAAPQPHANYAPHPHATRTLHADAVGNGSFDGSSSANSAALPPQYQQPQQPMALGPLDLVLQHLHGFEQRINARLHSLEERLMNIEAALLEPDQPLQ